MLTQTEENYIKAIYTLSEGGNISVSTNALSDTLHTKPASVSDMVKKLSQKAFVDYVKYKGVNLTTSGIKEALKIIRKHRLWEVFLVNKLGFKWDEVHDIAEQLEHIKSPVLTEKLDQFLGFPKLDPHGDPIPAKNGEMIEQSQICMENCQTGYKGTITGVNDDSSSFLQYLSKIGLSLGTQLEVIEVIEFDQSVLIRIENNKELMLSKQATQNIYLST